MFHDDVFRGKFRGGGGLDSFLYGWWKKSPEGKESGDNPGEKITYDSRRAI